MLTSILTLNIDNLFFSEMLTFSLLKVYSNIDIDIIHYIFDYRFVKEKVKVKYRPLVNFLCLYLHHSLTGSAPSPPLTDCKRGCLRVYREPDHQSVGHAVCLPAPLCTGRDREGQQDIPRPHRQVGQQGRQHSSGEGQKEFQHRSSCGQNPSSSC